MAAGIDRTRSLGRACTVVIGPPVERRSRRLRSHLARGLTVFVFHEVTDEPSEFQRRASLYSTPAVFERQIRWIRERFEVIPATRLRQLGGDGQLPANAALITFDDAWSGTFTIGLPILESLSVPALCFINSATVEGAPDLGAVRLYERLVPLPDGPLLARKHTLSSARALLDEIAERYGADRDFASFQGATATAEELTRAAKTGSVWFGLHLHHHWDLALIDRQLFEASLEENAGALEQYGNALPALAPPYGRRVPSLMAVAQEHGLGAVFVAGGRQNRSATGPMIDRITLPFELEVPPVAEQWWYETHRRRLFGRLARA
jgi:peptidoglycan/xylan/chitin deacetylase (PgdA/CDA1 family)